MSGKLLHNRITKVFPIFVFIWLAWGQSKSNTSKIDYYELGAIAAKKDFNSLPYWGLGLCSPGNPLLAFAAVYLPINIDEKHNSITKTKNGKNFISGYRKEITDLSLKSVAMGCGITLITAATAFLSFF